MSKYDWHIVWTRNTNDQPSVQIQVPHRADRLNGRRNSFSRSSKAGVAPLSAISFAFRFGGWSKLLFEAPPNKNQSSSVFVPIEWRTMKKRKSKGLSSFYPWKLQVEMLTMVLTMDCPNWGLVIISSLLGCASDIKMINDEGHDVVTSWMRLCDHQPWGVWKIPGKRGAGPKLGTQESYEIGLSLFMSKPMMTVSTPFFSKTHIRERDRERRACCRDVYSYKQWYIYTMYIYIIINIYIYN